MPWLVIVGQVPVCTGSIIGSQHVLTVGHCYHYTADYIRKNAVKYVYLGVHRISTIRSNSGVACYRAVEIHGMDIKGNSAEFPISPPTGCKLGPMGEPFQCKKNKHILDIAVLTLNRKINFDGDFSLTTKQAKLAPPSLSCKRCIDECSKPRIFDASGWGFRGQGMVLLLR